MKTESPGTLAVRRPTCERCGVEFDCGLGGACWCAAEPYRLAMPAGDKDCLCPNCLRIAADERK